MVLVPMDLSSLFPSRAEFEPAADFEPFRKLVPARWVVYLMADADDRPVQLLCVKNLRYSLERRLHGEETLGPSKRVNYREIVRRIYYRRVDSAFEADVVYLEAARGKACAYKEMGKCPAPCDGSISIEQYRRLIEWSLATLVDPDEMIRQQTRRMQSAATDLKFEMAAKIKAHIDSLAQLRKGPFRHVRHLKDFNYLSLQRGPRDGLAKAFLITPGHIEEIAGLISEPARPSELMRLAFTLAAERASIAVDKIGAERIGVVAHHLFQAKAQHGVFLP